MTRFRWMLVAMAVFGLVLFAQESKKKEFTLQGVVQEVDLKEKLATVKHGEVPGYMAAMTMPFEVKDEAMLKKLKVGDEIKATVYEGEYALYNIVIVKAKQ